MLSSSIPKPTENLQFFLRLTSSVHLKTLLILSRLGITAFKIIRETKEKIEIVESLRIKNAP